ncbi:hypothetical protein BKA62DRAFT_677678 [Auriculariales sp. MPI-PUGE-AT-0066]|nr:hypothetical protein BKA62DRAFT_677678 [Auriculariales sp. MPI-PUGE-AT-0066]
MAAVAEGASLPGWGPRDDVQPRAESRKCFLEHRTGVSRGYHSARPVQPVVSSLRAIFKVKNDATYLREDNPRKEHDAAIRPKKKEGSVRAQHGGPEPPPQILLEQQAVAEKTAAASTPTSATTFISSTLALDELAVKRVRQKRELANLEVGVPSTAESRAEEKECKLHSGGGDLSSNVLMDLGKAAAHLALFRMIFGEGMLRDMAKACKKEAQ